MGVLHERAYVEGRVHKDLTMRQCFVGEIAQNRGALARCTPRLDIDNLVWLEGDRSRADSVHVYCTKRRLCVMNTTLTLLDVFSCYTSLFGVNSKRFFVTKKYSLFYRSAPIHCQHTLLPTFCCQLCGCRFMYIFQRVKSPLARHLILNTLSSEIVISPTQGDQKVWRLCMNVCLTISPPTYRKVS